MARSIRVLAWVFFAYVVILAYLAGCARADWPFTVAATLVEPTDDGRVNLEAITICFHNAPELSHPDCFGNEGDTQRYNGTAGRVDGKDTLSQDDLAEIAEAGTEPEFHMTRNPSNLCDGCGSYGGATYPNRTSIFTELAYLEGLMENRPRTPVSASSNADELEFENCSMEGTWQTGHTGNDTIRYELMCDELRYSDADDTTATITRKSVGGWFEVYGICNSSRARYDNLSNTCLARQLQDGFRRYYIEGGEFKPFPSEADPIASNWTQTTNVLTGTGTRGDVNVLATVTIYGADARTVKNQQGNVYVLKVDLSTTTATITDECKLRADGSTEYCSHTVVYADGTQPQEGDQLAGYTSDSGSGSGGSEDVVDALHGDDTERDEEAVTQIEGVQGAVRDTIEGLIPHDIDDLLGSIPAVNAGLFDAFTQTWTVGGTCVPLNLDWKTHSGDNVFSKFCEKWDQDGGGRELVGWLLYILFAFACYRRVMDFYSHPKALGA